MQPSGCIASGIATGGEKDQMGLSLFGLVAPGRTSLTPAPGLVAFSLPSAGGSSAAGLQLPSLGGVMAADTFKTGPALSSAAIAIAIH